MIPKIIHYCWFGNNQIPDIIQKCLESWRIFMPDYEIKLWNEKSVPISDFRFMKQAYAVRKWAFVSDYARYLILYKYGGFFLDCDVEVLKSFDSLRGQELFFAFQDHVKKNVCFVAPGLIIGAEKEHPFILKVLNYYDNLEFVDSGGTIHYEYSSPRVITKLLLEETDLKIMNKTQNLSNGIKIYASEFFDPKNPRAIFSDGIHLTSNTYTIHHGAGSWIPRSRKIKRLFSILLRNIVGDTLVDSIHGQEKV